MTANIRSGLASTGGGDANAPYLYQHRSAAGSPRTGPSFAIAPTDGTSAQLGVDSALEGRDLVAGARIPPARPGRSRTTSTSSPWGDDMRRWFTSGSASDACILVPDDYTVEVMPYSDPAAIAGVCSNVVLRDRAGRFLLKLSTRTTSGPCRYGRASTPTPTSSTARLAKSTSARRSSRALTPRRGISADLAAASTTASRATSTWRAPRRGTGNPRVPRAALLSEAEQLKAPRTRDDPLCQPRVGNLRRQRLRVTDRGVVVPDLPGRRHAAPLRIPNVPQLYTRSGRIPRRRARSSSPPSAARRRRPSPARPSPLSGAARRACGHVGPPFRRRGRGLHVRFLRERLSARGEPSGDCAGRPLRR